MTLKIYFKINKNIKLELCLPEKKFNRATLYNIYQKRTSLTWYYKEKYDQCYLSNLSQNFAKIVFYTGKKLFRGII